jgi:ABC-type branched-subunit amino acid transport system substrate-binding protein
MKEALDTLKTEGININLYAYDTEKDNGKLASLLQSVELKNADLLVGPLLPSQAVAVGQYARQNFVSTVNPISNNSKLFDQNDFVYLFQPSLEIQAGQVAQLVKKQWFNKEKTKAAIYFGESPRDSLLAKYYRDSLLAQKIQVPIFEKLKKDKLFKLSSNLSDSTKLKGYTHVFVASNEEIIAATVISALEKSMNPIPVITRAEWLQLTTLNLEQLQKRNVHFMYPEFIDYSSILVKKFKENFAAKYNVLPSQYVYMGYDLMYYFAHVMKENGTNLKAAFTKPSAKRAIFLSAINFTNSNSNTYLPIVKFEEMKLKVVNPMEY